MWWSAARWFEAGLNMSNHHSLSLQFFSLSLPACLVPGSPERRLQSTVTTSQVWLWPVPTDGLLAILQHFLGFRPGQEPFPVSPLQPDSCYGDWETPVHHPGQACTHWPETSWLGWIYIATGWCREALLFCGKQALTSLMYAHRPSSDTQCSQQNKWQTALNPACMLCVVLMWSGSIAEPGEAAYWWS